MKKNLLMKISFIFLFIVMLFLCFGKSNVYATSTEIIDDVKDNNTIMLDENLNADEKIMKYDAITGETTEVNMQEIKQLISNLDKKNLTGTANQPNVIGYDAKMLQSITTTRALPPIRETTNMAVCKLEISGGSYGTATLVGSNVALTAAHCVWNEHTKVKYANLVIYPNYKNRSI